MGKSLLYVMMAGSEGGKSPVEFSARVNDLIWPFADRESAPDDSESASWRMTRRQALLEFQHLENDDGPVEIGPEMSLEALCAAANSVADETGASYVVAGDMIVGTAAVYPFPKTDWWEVGGPWTNDFALPRKVERPDVQTDCGRCGGRGHFPAKKYLLPRFLRLTAEGRRDSGEPVPCDHCGGKGHLMLRMRIEDAEKMELVRTAAEAVEIMDEEDIGGPWSLIDLNGDWHGTEGGVTVTAPGDVGRDPEEVFKDLVRPILQAAPPDTLVVPVAIHM